MKDRSRLPDRLKAALEVLFPFPCLDCHTPLRWDDQLLGLCVRCRGTLLRQSRSCCRGCGRSLPEGGCEVCGECLLRPPPWDRLVALYCYEPPLTLVIHALKFRRLEFLARDLGVLLGRELRDEEVDHCDVITPIPLSRLRLLRRGFNQAAVLARTLGEALDLPVRALLRRRTRSPQARLSRRDRLRNLQGSFTSRRSIPGVRVLLVDDVMTTGATLTAAARCLDRAGARVVLATVAGRTRRHVRARGRNPDPTDPVRTGFEGV